MYPRNMVCFRYVTVNTPYKSDNKDDNNNDDDNNNNVRRDNSRPMRCMLSVLFIKRNLLTKCTE